jgi:hypothetical protein
MKKLLSIERPKTAADTANLRMLLKEKGDVKRMPAFQLKRATGITAESCHGCMA